jgi:Heavy metal binding domain
VGESNQTPEVLGPGDPPRSRRAVLAARLLLLLLAAGAVGVSVVMGTPRGGGTGDTVGRYMCPMHPEVTAADPGACPICGMELEAVATGPSSINASTFQIYDFVRRRGFAQDLRAPAWVEGDGSIAAVLYKDVLPALASEEPAVFSPSGAPGSLIEVHPSSPQGTPWDRSTSLVHFHADAGALPLRPGDVGWVRLAVKRLEPEVIPYAAILEGDRGPYVLVSTGDGRMLSKRSVEIGRVLGGMAVVLSGLRLHERVLVRSAFFLDAERRLRREAAIELSP